MVQSCSFVAREILWRNATIVWVVAGALGCQAPGKDGLFDAPLGGAASTAGAGEMPTETPAEGDGDMDDVGPGAKGATEDETPPLLGFGGAAGESPPATSVTGATGSPDAGDAPAPVDVGIAPVDDCVLGEFQAPELLTGIDESLNPELTLKLWSPSLSADGRTLFFAISADEIDEQLATATRDDRGAAFSSAVALTAINSDAEDGTPLVSADGLTLYFYSSRPGGLGSRDVWLSTRADIAADFTAPTLLAGINGADVDHLPWLSPDELTILWATNRSGGVGQDDIWIARRNFRSDGFSSAAPLNGVNSPSEEGRAVLSNDGLTIYFASARPGGVGNVDLWVATRDDVGSSFSQVTNLAGVNSSGFDVDPVLSADERELIFSSSRDGRTRLWRSVRECE